MESQEKNRAGEQVFAYFSANGDGLLYKGSARPSKIVPIIIKRDIALWWDSICNGSNSWVGICVPIGRSQTRGQGHFRIPNLKNGQGRPVQFQKVGD